MKPIWGFSAPTALKIPKLVLMQVRRRRTCIKTNFYNENCC
ncbi:hypothetical protein APA_2334 [Pseudanabaena sp. lw0831]|nr:hypothetical protein APA_2334 [Pseudanabaena sp. lw0831]